MSDGLRSIEFTEGDRKMLARVYVDIDGIWKFIEGSAQELADVINAIGAEAANHERRIAAIERKLNHKTREGA